MYNLVPINLLKPHPKNHEYYGDLPEEKYEEVKRSIQEHGIRDPIKVLPDYTIVSGHQRHKIALELGMEKAPVEIVDLPEDEAEYLLIAENEERRQSDDDPIRKAKRAAFLKEYWGIRAGGNRKSKVEILPLRTINDIAETIGESAFSTKQLLKLNDLIPELQTLVSSGDLGQTAAYELAFLSPETQKALHDHYGKQIAEIKHAEAKELRRKIEVEVAAEKDALAAELRKKIESLQERNRELQVLHEDRERELERAILDLQEKMSESITPEKARKIQEDLRKKEEELAEEKRRAAETEQKLKGQIQELNRKLKIVPSEKIIEKVVEKILPDPKLVQELEEARRELAELKSMNPDEQKIKELKERIEELEKERWNLEREVGNKKTAITFMNYARQAIRPLEKAEEGIRELARGNLDGVFKVEVRQWIGLLKRVTEVLENVLTTVNIPEATVIDIKPHLERRETL
ncbi:MAG: ParB N-terminal domain-containing protein [Peptococcaceae bacterium]|nr:ParB N-terminal domain-containing protein [Peptococcaceae bacterium]